MGGEVIWSKKNFNEKGRRQVSLYSKLKSYDIQIALIAIIALAAILRFSGLHWGFYHPDEGFYTHIAWDFFQGEMDFGKRPADWPNIVHYTICSLLYIAHFVGITDLTAYSAILIGRYISATLSIITVLACYFIGKKIHSALAGLLSALMFTVAHLSVLHAHYATMDTALAFFFAITLLFSLNLADEKYDYKTLLITGILIGITIGIKYTGGIILIPALILLLLNNSTSLFKKGKDICTLLVVSIASYLASCPFILMTPGKYVNSLSELSNFSKGFYGLFPEFAESGLEWYLYHGIPWSYGLVYTLVLAIAIVYLLICSARRKDITLLSLLITIFLFFAYMNTHNTYMMRYLLPLTPIFATIIGLGISDLCIKLSEQLKGQHVWIQKLVPVILILVVIIHPFFFTVAYNNILSEKNVRLEATEWINVNLDPKEKLNIGPPPLPPSWMLPPLDKSRYMSQALPQSDTEYYLICEPLAQHIYLRYLSEPDLYLDEDFIPRKPPSDEILEYYSQLSYNTEDYNLIATFKKTPRFLWYGINESNAPYEVTHVTHPEIRVYRGSGNTTDA